MCSPNISDQSRKAMWWTVVTLTTVGYGDIVPHTVAGKFIATLTALMGVCVVALLTGYRCHWFYQSGGECGGTVLRPEISSGVKRWCDHQR
jgi:hypothetical protein